MFVIHIVIAALASPALGAVYAARANSCSGSEFACADGACVSRDRRCDGAADCADGSDERTCQTSPNQLDLNDLILNRYKRQSAISGCRKNQFRCRDGTCIRFDGKCDGVFDCPDHSDETHALCRKMSCPENLFRCTYGACVDGTAPCNGVQECADNSDELLPRCRNATQPVKSQFRCDDGEVIKATDHCDGKADCADGSDETIASCAGKRCPSYYFQCAYGACVDSGANCDGKKDCVDNSDESDELCDRNTSATTTRPIGNTCVLPAFPENGVYSLEGERTAVPGQTRSTAVLIVSCKSGYGVIGSNRTECYYGRWQAPIPQCSRFCKLPPHPSVEYFCKPTDPRIIDGRRLCDEYEPNYTEVFPSCKRPNYYEKIVLTKMVCVDGSWNYVAICYPECGTPTPRGTELVAGGVRAEKGELPWHAGIYEKATTPYKQICGGSLVTTTAVISAAHCFWKGGFVHRPEEFAVGLGKIYRPWANPEDKGAQMSNVSDLRIPSEYRDSESYYQADIALVFLSTPIVLAVYIRPVCLDFGDQFDGQQLQTGHSGKVAGWGRSGADAGPSSKLLTTNMSFVDADTCRSEMPRDFIPYLTIDKFCAGDRNGTAVCEGDSGGGLAFPMDVMGTLRYYLRGIVSTAPTSSDHLCNLDVYITFTKIHSHEIFIKQNLPDQY